MRPRFAALPIAVAPVIAVLLAGLAVAPAGAALLPTTTTLTLPTGTIAFGVPVDLTVHVSPATAPGSVDFIINNQGVATGFLFNGVATAHLGGLGAPGPVTVSAHYNGSGSYAASTSAPQTVEVVDLRPPVSVSIDIDPPTVERGESITIDTSVVPNPGGGTVDFYDGNTLMVLSTPLEADGTASRTVVMQTSGIHPIKVCFNGTITYFIGCSDVIPYVVTSHPSTTTLTIEPSTVFPDEQFTVGVTVDPPPEVAASAWIGTSYYNNRAWVPISAVTGHGEVTLAADAGYGFPLGAYDLQAFFPGTPHVDASVSGVVKLTVRLTPSSLDTGVTATPVTVGDPITFTAHVNPTPTDPSAGVAFALHGPVETGFGDNVGFALNGSTTGQTTVDTDHWPAGEYWYTATFGGDPQLAQATDQGTFTLVDVDPPSGEVSVSDGTTEVISSTVTVDAPASDGVGSGVTLVALSNDDATWTQQAYEDGKPITWALAAGDGVRTVFAKWRDQAGNWSDVAQDSVTVHTSAATVSALTAGWLPGSALTSGGKVPLRVSWSHAAGTVAGFQLEQSVDGGAWSVVIASTPATSVTPTAAPGHTVRYRVRALDAGGNGGPWTTQASALRVDGYQQSSAKVAWSGKWTGVKDAAAWGGSYRRSGAAGATATIHLTGRGAAWVARTGPTRGVATVWVGGHKVATVNLYSPTWQVRRVVWSASWSSAKDRTVRVRVSGTHGRPTVEIDGFLALR